MPSPVHPVSPSVSLARGRQAAAFDALASTDALWVRSSAPARRRAASFDAGQDPLRDEVRPHRRARRYGAWARCAHGLLATRARPRTLAVPAVVLGSPESIRSSPSDS
ncbi:hypothetical protein SETIT_5G180200v2 [Setaria italica]|uniref:Uncharacterized protein n=1 Tax=Setaria italica TaxID=4555 RepID=K3XNG3_SETIT|nr:hypothetical protein SETIT_5G180200v2 [Setaria italica]